MSSFYLVINEKNSRVAKWVLRYFNREPEEISGEP